MPEVGVDGQRRLKAGSVLCIGAGGLGSPAAMYLAAAGVGTHRHRRLRRRRLQQPAAADHPRHARRRPLEAGVGEGSPATRSTRTSRSRPTRRRCRPRTRCELFEPLRRHPRRHRQLPDALSDQRRLRAARQAERLRQHLPVRRAGVGVRDEGRSLLSLPLSRAAAAGPGAELRRRRRARRAAGRHRRDPGDRGDQADHRHRRAAHRPVPDLRRAADAVPRAEAARRIRIARCAARTRRSPSSSTTNSSAAFILPRRSRLP